MKFLTILLIFITFYVCGDIEYSINDKKIGNIIKAKVDGKEVQLTTQDEKKCYLLSKVLDY